ncbi:MAG: site-specific integrase [Clostridiaceae bacterium]|nr:site-specific integrase [Clostridiaceae bacterium]
MRVESIVTSESKLRYLLVNDVGDPVEPVLKYLKYKDNTGAARNILRAYSYHLKLFFEYLEQEQLDYQNIGIDEMASFMRWLQNPYSNMKVSPISTVSSSRTARTINLVISAVISFYDYLMRHDD